MPGLSLGCLVAAYSQTLVTPTDTELIGYALELTPVATDYTKFRFKLKSKFPWPPNLTSHLLYLLVLGLRSSLWEGTCF